MTRAEPQESLHRVDNDLRRDSCPFCGSQDIRMRGLVDYVRPILFSTIEISLMRAPEIWDCRNCFSMFTQNAIPERIAFDLYARGTGAERWDTRTLENAKHRAVLKVLNGLLARDRTVLDIGCNTGELLDFARSRGCRTSGVEVCAASRDILVGKQHAVFSSLYDVKDRYDLIFAFDLVEHIYHPSQFFAFCRSHLSNGGALVISTGDIASASARLAGSKWWYFKFPEHLVFPSRKYLWTLTGLRIVDWIRSYAAIGFEAPRAVALAHFVVKSIRRSYDGSPALGPDHLLLVCGK